MRNKLKVGLVIFAFLALGCQKEKSPLQQKLESREQADSVIKETEQLERNMQQIQELERLERESEKVTAGPAAEQKPPKAPIKEK